ncbi:MAG: hypothetical protein ABIR66_02440 [Saprospiraceae bacterium]
MTRVSSGWTLVLKIFLPVFYGVFMLTWTVATIKSGDEVSPLFETRFYKIAMTTLFIIGMLIVRYTVWRLKRMDISNPYIYVTDYFKTFRYTVDSIDSMNTFYIGWLKFLRVELREKGSLGKRFIVLLEKSMWDSYLDTHPDFHKFLGSTRG